MNVEAGVAYVLHSKKTAPHENNFFLSLLPLSVLLQTHMKDTTFYHELIWYSFLPCHFWRLEDTSTLIFPVNCSVDAASEHTCQDTRYRPCRPIHQFVIPFFLNVTEHLRISVPQQWHLPDSVLVYCLTAQNVNVASKHFKIIMQTSWTSSKSVIKW